MKAGIGVLGLLVVVLVIGLLAKKQLSLGTTPAAPGVISSPVGTPQQQRQQLQNQVKKSVDEAMQKARPEQDDK